MDMPVAYLFIVSTIPRSAHVAPEPAEPFCLRSATHSYLLWRRELCPCLCPRGPGNKPVYRGACERLHSHALTAT